MVLNFIMLLLASITTVLFLVNLARGKQYGYMVESLDGGEYFLKELYVVGFSLNDGKIFKLRGKMERNLKKQAKLLWGDRYYEYYANLAWAQFLSLTLLVVSVGFSLSGFLKTEQLPILLILVLLFVAAFWNLSLSRMKEKVQQRREACEAEFPNMVSKLALLINSGMVLREAWRVTAYGKEGTLYKLMKQACEDMENGESDVGAIYKFGVTSDSASIKKFTSAMIQGMQKGNSELADFMVSQTSELWAHKRQMALQQGEVAAGKLIIPLGITFAGIIMIIVSAAMQSMSF
ncbi:secretion protein F [Roseburia hominis]|uniref:secretion protein F n=1 Tax=Roseburia hominis TaxID=301301 RepID=UPI00242EBA5F|nr:secretion protein F [Roseburia hominis]